MDNKEDCFKIKKIKRKNIRQFEQSHKVEPKGFEMNQSKGSFLKNQNFCYTIGQVRLYKRTIYF